MWCSIIIIVCSHVDVVAPPTGRGNVAVFFDPFTHGEFPERMLSRFIIKAAEKNAPRLVGQRRSFHSIPSVARLVKTPNLSNRRAVAFGTRSRLAVANRQCFGRPNQFSSRYFSGDKPLPPPPRPPPRRSAGGTRRRSPAEARQAGGSTGGRSGRGRKKPKSLVNQNKGISWLGVGAVGTVVSIGIGIAYYSQNGAEHMPSFLKKWIALYAPSGSSIMTDDYEEPPSRLLPNFHPEQLQEGGRDPPTLVIGLEDTLVHVSWDRQNGFRVAKRPGVDRFLNTMAMYYEIVIFTKMAFAGADEIIYRLDPNQCALHKLYKNSLVKIDDGR